MDKKEKYKLYLKIVERAERLGITTKDRIQSMLDIESADLKFNLDLVRWLRNNEPNFIYDFCGIQKYIVRDVFPATDFGFFIPKFSRTDETLELLAYLSNGLEENIELDLSR